MAQTQSAPNFGTLLDKPSSEVERPKPLPQGSYHCIVKGLPRFDVSSKKKTEFVEFTLAVQSAGEDVDEDDLKNWMVKGDGSSRRIQDATIRATYYITEDALWRLKDFLQHCGIEEGESIRAMIDESPNCEVIAYIRHRASEDGEAMFAELAKTAPVEG
jgi:hypothetical protein